MGKSICRVPMTSLWMKDAREKRLTIAIVGTSISTTSKIPSHCQIAHDSVFRAIGLGYLIVTTAFNPLTFIHLPLLKASHCDILPEKHIESSIDVLEQVISNEDNRIKSFKDHADFQSWVPAIMASCGGERSFKSMPSASTHGLKKGCASATIWDLRLAGPIAWKWWNVEICRWNATVLMSFKVVKMTMRYYQQEFWLGKCFHLLPNWTMWETYSVNLLRWLCESTNTPQQHKESGEGEKDDSPGKSTKGSITSHFILWCRNVLVLFGSLRGNGK